MRKCLLVMVILWVAVISWFSNQPLQESTDQTYAFLVKLNLAEQRDLVLSSTEEIRSLKHLTRKAAHFGLYYGLGGLIGLLVYGLFRIKGRMWSVTTWSLGSAWGVIDEIHQYFVPGRSMQFADMVIDSSGVFLAVVTLGLVLGLYERMKDWKAEERRVLEELY